MLGTHTLTAARRRFLPRFDPNRVSSILPTHGVVRADSVAGPDVNLGMGTQAWRKKAGAATLLERASIEKRPQQDAFLKVCVCTHS